MKVKKDFRTLSDLDVMEVSLVSKGANQKKFAIFKLDGEELSLSETLVKSILDGKFDEQEINLGSVEGISKEDLQTLSTSLKMMKSLDGRLPKEIASRLVTLVGNSSESAGKGGGTSGDQINKNRQNLTGEDMKINLEELTPEVRAHIEKLEKDRNEERSMRLVKEFVAKASEFKNLGTKPEEFGIVLKNLSEGSSEQANEVMAIFKAADEKIATLMAEKEAVEKELAEVKKEPKDKAEETAETKVEEVAEIKKSIDELNTRLEKLQSSPSTPRSEGTDKTEDVKKADGGENDIWAGVL